jgi:hypothetical protein
MAEGELMSNYTPVGLSIEVLRPVLDGNGALTDFEATCTLRLRDDTGVTVDIPNMKVSAFAGGGVEQLDLASQLFSVVFLRLKTQYGIT